MGTRIKCNKTLFWMMLIFDAILVAGSVAYAVMVNIIDAIYPLGRLSAEEGMERLDFLMARDNVLAVTIWVYLIGQVLCGCIVMWKRLQVIIMKSCFAYYASQLLIAFVCTAPFALMSERSIYDYIQPVLSIAGNLALIILVFYFSFKTRTRINKVIEGK